MSLSSVLTWLPLVIILGMMVRSRLRAIAYWRRGVRVVMTGLDGSVENQRAVPPRIIALARTPMHGTPYQQEQICTSHVERMNGSIRRFCKRMGRLTYCFSKRSTNHRAALGLYFCHYNWRRSHKTLKGMTPAMSHGLADHRWSMRELTEWVMAN